MTQQNNTLTRRTFLKGAAYTSALSLGSLSGVALAKPASATQSNAGQSNGAAASGLMAVTLANQSDRAVMLDARQPVQLEEVNDWVVVKINKAQTSLAQPGAGQQISLAPGQQGSFTVDAAVAPALNAGGAYIVISNEFSPLDNVVPLTHCAHCQA